MQTGMDCSRPCHVGLADGVPICIFGAVPIDSPVTESIAGVWFMATDDAFEKHSVAILRRSSAWIKLLDYDRLINTSRSDIPELVFWMEWLGFEPLMHTTDDGFPMNHYQREAC
jgi:hypothetical protein